MAMESGLGFDDEQLAAALELVQFSEKSVLEAVEDAKLDGAAQVGFFPFQGQSQFAIHPVLTWADDCFALCVVAMNQDYDCMDASYNPSFTVALKTAQGDVLMSQPQGDGNNASPAILLPSLDALIGAQLEWVA